MTHPTLNFYHSKLVEHLSQFRDDVKLSVFFALYEEANFLPHVDTILKGQSNEISGLPFFHHTVAMKKLKDRKSCWTTVLS